MNIQLEKVINQDHTRISHQTALILIESEENISSKRRAALQLNEKVSVLPSIDHKYLHLKTPKNISHTLSVKSFIV